MYSLIEVVYDLYRGYCYIFINRIFSTRRTNLNTYNILHKYHFHTYIDLQWNFILNHYFFRCNLLSSRQGNSELHLLLAN